MKKTSNKRLIVSLTLLVSLIMMPVTGIMIHLMHAKEEVSHNWLHLHVIFGVIFIIAGVYHVVINWQVLKYYLTGKK